jgi:hypothetical protein
VRTDRGRRSRRDERRLATALAELKPAAWAAVAAALLALVVMTVLSAGERADEARVADAFPPEDVEAARIKVLPYRQSGLIFSWGNTEPTILVDTALWDALPRDRQRDLGQAMAIAKNARVVRLRDGRTKLLIAICTAAGHCRDGSREDQPEPGADLRSVWPRAAPQRTPVIRSSSPSNRR